jgi:hypothetical protein
MIWSRRTLLVGSILVTAGGCDWIQDRFRSCGHMSIDLVNSDQSIDPITILQESEQKAPELLLASGSSRRITQCVERGDVKRFRALRGDTPVAVANCAVSRARYEYETTLARVVWDPRGLVCENW